MGIVVEQILKINKSYLDVNRFRCLTLIGILIGIIFLVNFLPVNAEKIIVVKKIIDLPKENFQDLILDVEGYKEIFPEYVKSAELKDQIGNKTLTNLKVGANGFYFDADIEHIHEENDFHELNIISGEFKGTSLKTVLEETWGYDGSEGMGTIVKIKMSLHVSGILGFLGIVSEDMVKFSIDQILLTLSDKAKS